MDGTNARRIAVTEDRENRYILYRVQGSVLYKLLQNDAVSEEEYLPSLKNWKPKPTNPDT